ncbi:MAG: 16S rRNA (uracil(1498)-N(3))-methyltransferase [Verrucomicrobiota bacterium]
MHRFYIPSANWNPESLVLTGDEAHHCTQVVRCRVGEKVVAFNGEGTEATTEITEAEPGGVTLKTISVATSTPLRARITLAQAIPKGKNMDLIIQKATELGAAEIVPIISERTIVRLEPDEAAKKQEKWQRVALEACKQCGQNFLPTVAAPITIDDFFAQKPSADLPLVASLQPGAISIKEILAESGNNRPTSALMLVGPEGDYTPAEINAAKAFGCRPVTLGPIVLRTETAAIFTLSVLAYELM